MHLAPSVSLRLGLAVAFGCLALAPGVTDAVECFQGHANQTAMCDHGCSIKVTTTRHGAVAKVQRAWSCQTGLPLCIKTVSSNTNSVRLNGAVQLSRHVYCSCCKARCNVDVATCQLNKPGPQVSGRQQPTKMHVVSAWQDDDADYEEADVEEPEERTAERPQDRRGMYKQMRDRSSRQEGVNWQRRGGPSYPMPIRLYNKNKAGPSGPV